MVGQRSENPALREWHTNSLGRLPGLKLMRTLWVCNVAGGPFQYSPTQPGSTAVGLEEAHRNLDSFKVPDKEKDEVLGAFAAHKDEVTEGYMATAGG